METLSNFSSAYCFISFILGALFMLTMLCIAAMGKVQEPINKVHFYVARDKNSLLYLYLGKPKRADFSFMPCKNGYCIISKSDFQKFDLNPNDFKNLKWEDEPVEVFVNMEDL